MVAFLLGWLVPEGLLVCLKWNHIRIGYYNTPTVSWTTKFASRSSKVSGRLVRVLSLCMRERETAPLSSHHITVIKNLLGDVPSRLFGYKINWRFTCDKKFLTFFNNSFPLPKQQCWRICVSSIRNYVSTLNTVFCGSWRSRPALLFWEWERVVKEGEALFVTCKAPILFISKLS